MYWEDMFKDRILDRGLEYYTSGLVCDFTNDGQSISANVIGGDQYSVFIRIANGEVAEMHCDCPYAWDGHNCKHMAAVLYHMDLNGDTNDNDVLAESENESGEDSIKKLVKDANVKLVQDFLIDALEKDDKLLSKFKSMFSYEITAEDIKKYKQRLDNIFEGYVGRDGYINYYSARLLIDDIIRFIKDDVEVLVHNKYCSEAFEIINYVFIEVADKDFDDSDGGKGTVAEYCLEIWQTILDYSDIEFKRTMFRWFLEKLDGSVIDYMEEYIIRILFDDFSEEEFIKEKFVFSENQINKHKNAKESWVREYETQNWLKIYIDLMEEANMPAEKIAEFCKENIEFSDIREIYIEYCVNNKDYDTAIKILKEGRKMYSKMPGLVSKYSKRLKEIYKLTENMQAYKAELWDLALEYEEGELDIYKELKALYTPEEWEIEREKIFDKISKSDANGLYEEEELYDRLLKNVLATNGLYTLELYEDILMNLYPEELLNKYEVTVRAMAPRSSNRSDYNELANILRKMNAYPGGQKITSELIREWMVTYKNRPAMKDELSKV